MHIVLFTSIYLELTNADSEPMIFTHHFASDIKGKYLLKSLDILSASGKKWLCFYIFSQFINNKFNPKLWYQGY